MQVQCHLIHFGGALEKSEKSDKSQIPVANFGDITGTRKTKRVVNFYSNDFG